MVSALSDDLGKAMGLLSCNQSSGLLACLLEIVQISLIKHINPKSTICGSFTKWLEGKKHSI